MTDSSSTEAASMRPRTVEISPGTAKGVFQAITIDSGNLCRFDHGDGIAVLMADLGMLFDGISVRN